MAELTHDEDGFHEIQLSGKQIVFLFMATTVVLVSIFLCGVMVGRGVRAQQGEEPLDVVATNGPTPRTDAAGQTPSLPPTVDEPVGYDDQLRKDKPPAEPALKQQDAPQSTPPPPPPPAPEETKPVVESRPEVDVPTTGRPGQWVLQLTAVKNRASATEIVKRLIDKGHPAYVQNPAPREPVKIYRVRVGGFKDRREAERLAQRLQKEEQFSPVVTTR